MPFSTTTFAQTGSPTPRRAADGVYEVAVSDLKKLDSSPEAELPRDFAAYEVSDSIAIAVTISPEGKVKKTKPVSGNNYALKDAAEKAVKKWAFQPYLVNGTAVPVRTEVVVVFDNTLDHYRESNGDIPVRLDENASRALIIKLVRPQYPSDAAAGRISGKVELRVIVGEDGSVHALHIIRGHPMLASAAYEAVRQWTFKPYVQNGKTLPVDTKMSVNLP